MASAARASRSAKLFTTSTCAVIPLAGVPMLPPSPSIGSGARRGVSISADSSPRTQCGTIAASVCTLSSPSSFIRATIQSIACSSDFDPLSRFPKVSVRRAIRFHAALSFIDSAMMRSAVAR